MPFTITLHFVSAHDRDAFAERVAPRLRGQIVDPPADEVAEAEGYHRIAVSVTSPSAAKDTCSQAFGFLAHMKNARIAFRWPLLDGDVQYGEITSGAGREADLLSVRLGAAAKAALDAEKAQAAPGEAAEPDAPADA